MARMLNRRQTLAGLALGCATGGRAFAQAVDEPDSWPELKHLFFNDAPIQEDKSLVSFEAPVRAEDAAIVPMSFSAKLPEGDTRRVVKLTLVIDENPVPLAAAFALGEKAGDKANAPADVAAKRALSGPEGAAGSRVVAGNRLLLIEDEALVGMMMKDTLIELGFEVIGPYATFAAATAAIFDEDFHGAILDVNLDGELVYPLAEMVAAHSAGEDVARLQSGEAREAFAAFAEKVSRIFQRSRDKSRFAP